MGEEDVAHVGVVEAGVEEDADAHKLGGDADEEEEEPQPGRGAGGGDALGVVLGGPPGVVEAVSQEREAGEVGEEGHHVGAKLLGVGLVGELGLIPDAPVDVGLVGEVGGDQLEQPCEGHAVEDAHDEGVDGGGLGLEEADEDEAVGEDPAPPKGPDHQRRDHPPVVVLRPFGDQRVGVNDPNPLEEGGPEVLPLRRHEAIVEVLDKVGEEVARGPGEEDEEEPRGPDGHGVVPEQGLLRHRHAQGPDQPPQIPHQRHEDAGPGEGVDALDVPVSVGVEGVAAVHSARGGHDEARHDGEARDQEGDVVVGAQEVGAGHVLKHLGHYSLGGLKALHEDVGLAQRHVVVVLEALEEAVVLGPGLVRHRVAAVEGPGALLEVKHGGLVAALVAADAGVHHAVVEARVLGPVVRGHAVAVRVPHLAGEAACEDHVLLCDLP